MKNCSNKGMCVNEKNMKKICTTNNLKISLKVSKMSQNDSSYINWTQTIWQKQSQVTFFVEKFL